MDGSFSVIVPTCDRPILLERALRSVMSQTLLPIEVLVIDNGRVPVEVASLPADGTIKLVRGLPRFGVMQARNLGAILSKGKYISFLDDDDAWEDGYLEAVWNTFNTLDADVVLGARKESNGSIKLSQSAPIESKDDFLYQLFLRNPGATGSVSNFRRDTFFKSKGYDPYLVSGEDRALILDLMHLGAKVARAEEAYMVFLGPGNTERLNNFANIFVGKRRFLQKYWSKMGWGLRVVLVWRLFLLSFRRFR